MRTAGKLHWPLPADRAFIEPTSGLPGQFDFMGATQFRLLTTLGLREHHSVLDFGCGSLRAGRLLIPYLGGGSIDFFSYAGPDIVSVALSGFKRCLKTNGLALATFIQPAQLGDAEEASAPGWLYPGCLSYNVETVIVLISNAGLSGRPIPWFHPRQTWFVIAHSPDGLPSAADDIHLSGVVLRANIQP